MSNFQYKAVNARGEFVEGQLSASSTRTALLQLEKMGLKVESIQRQEIEHEAVDRNSSTEPSELLELRKRALQNARLWSAPIAALSEEIGSDRISRTLRRTAQRLSEVNRVEQLCSDAEIAQVFPFVVHDLDSSPLSESWLERMAKDIRTKQQFRRDMLIPIITFTFFCILLILGSIWIIPIFKEMFDDFGLTLAPPTRLLFTVSSWIYPHYLRSLAVIALAGIALYAFWRSNHQYGWLQQFAPRLTAGSRSNLRNMGQFVQNLAEFRRLGYPIPHAMHLAIESCPNQFLKSKVSSFVDGVMAGQEPNYKLLRVLPVSLVALLYAEPSNVSALHELGVVYSDRERASSGKLPILLSHLIILGVGFVVAFAIIALFMPQVSMITSLV